MLGEVLDNNVLLTQASVSGRDPSDGEVVLVDWKGLGLAENADEEPSGRCRVRKRPRREPDSDEESDFISLEQGLAVAKVRRMQRLG